MGGAYRVCRVGDQVLWMDKDSRDWYVQGYYQLQELASGFSNNLAAFTIFGRIAGEDSSRGFDFRLPKEVVPELRVVGVPLVGRSVVQRLLELPRLAGTLKRCVAENDIIWFMLPSIAGLVGLLWTRQGGVRVAQMVGDWTSLGLMGANPTVVSLLGRLTQIALRRADLVIFVSKQLETRFGSIAEVPTLVANESRLQLSMLRRVDRTRVHSPVRLLFAGRLSPEKGVPTLLDAVAQVNREIPCELWVAGAGVSGGELRGRAETLGIAHLVRWLGWISWGEPLFSVMRDVDMLVLPSVTEGLPLVLIDAMSQSLPVIASDCGGISEIIQHEMNGLLFPPRDAALLAERIRQLVRDVNLRQRLVAAGLETAKQNTVDQNTGRVIHEILSIAENRTSKDNRHVPRYWVS